MIGYPFAHRPTTERIADGPQTDAEISAEAHIVRQELRARSVELHRLTPVGDEPNTGRRAVIAEDMDRLRALLDSFAVAQWVRQARTDDRIEVRWETTGGASIIRPRRPDPIRFDTFTGGTIGAR